MLKQLRKHTRLIIWLVIIAFGGWGGFAVGTQFQDQGNIAGKVFGKPVYFQEYGRVHKATILFSGDAEIVSDPEILRLKTWQNITLAREAKRLKIHVSDQEVRNEIARILKDQNIENASTALYERWVRTALNQSPKDFEEQIRELLRSQKLIRQVTEDVIDAPTEEEAYDRFLRENSNLNLQMVMFPSQDEAAEFYTKVSSLKKWEKEIKEIPDQVKTTALIAMDAIINLWRIPEEEAWRVFDQDIDAIIAPTRMGSKTGVLRILDKQFADESLFDEAGKEKYMQKLLDQRMRIVLMEWGMDLQERANLEDLLPRPERAPIPPALPTEASPAEPPVEEASPSKDDQPA